MNIVLKIVTILILCCLTACTSNNVTITKLSQKNEKPDTLTYSTYWTALRCIKPELIDQYKVSNDILEFSRGIQLIKNGEFQNAESTFLILAKDSKNDTVIENSKSILNQLFIYQSKWKEFYNFNKFAGEPDSSAIERLLFPAYMNSPKEEITFSNEPDTLRIKCKSNSIFIPVSINGKQYELLFDTGAQYTILSSEITNETDIKKLFTHMSALKGSTKFNSNVFTALIDKLNIGNFSVKNYPCMITDASNMKFKFWFYTFFSFDGIIGWNVIKNLDVTLDFQNKIIIIKKPQRKIAHKKNLFWMNDPIVHLKASNGSDIFFIFDSGSQYSYFSDLLLMKLTPDKLKKGSETVYAIGGKINREIKIIPYISFNLDNYSLNFIDFKSGYQTDGNFFVVDGILGNDITKDAKIHIDATNGIFEITKETNE